jgi:hypothetical protein
LQSEIAALPVGLMQQHCIIVLELLALFLLDIAARDHAGFICFCRSSGRCHFALAKDYVGLKLLREFRASLHWLTVGASPTNGLVTATRCKTETNRQSRQQKCVRFHRHRQIQASPNEPSRGKDNQTFNRTALCGVKLSYLFRGCQDYEHFVSKNFMLILWCDC